MRWWMLAAVVLGSACRNTVVTGVDSDIVIVDQYADLTDADGDGFYEDDPDEAKRDCDDANPDVNPDGVEIPYDALDNDCDPTTPDDDLDGDGFLLEDDCDDTDPDIHPGATEICDDIDNDCNLLIDDNVGDLWYVDVDGDGFGDPETATAGCDADSDQVEDNTDCDDQRAEVNPDADEVCDGLDNNCDGEIDVGAADALSWYADTDGDGYGDLADVEMSCAPVGGRVLDNSDCDDTAQMIHPAAPEFCNGLDDNCDGVIDQGAVDAELFYEDLDGDGAGTNAGTVMACELPTGFALAPDDCDDSSADRAPGLAEVCDGLDNDCNLLVDDEPTDGTAYFRDLDRDGFGVPTETKLLCAVEDGWAATSDDCDDIIATVHPGASEICDSLDNDCNGLVDDNAVGLGQWYRDADGDGFGNVSDTQVSCQVPNGYVASPDDCDDGRSDVRPGEPEVCDGADNNCDGQVDNDPVGAPTWYVDADNDDFGSPSASQQACTQPVGYADSALDCNDGDSLINPAADEVCDSVDNDCDGGIDNNATDATPYFADNDGDGYGDPGQSQLSCAVILGFSSNSDDCDDFDATIRPGVPELCDSVDNDCNGVVDDNAVDPDTWWIDTDADGYGSSDASVQACELPAGYAETSDDCDDTRDVTYPGAPELCDGQDNDCNGFIDDNALADATWFADDDGDGFGDPDDSVISCEAPLGYVGNSTDCDDGDATEFPGNDETCDGQDNNCNGLVDESPIDGSVWYRDADVDTYGDASDTQVACQAPNGYVGDATDCDDTNPATYPNATEVCDGFDNDCDGQVDEGATNNGTWYQDLDGDGYGVVSATQVSCTPPVGYVAAPGDCDDTIDTINPGADELCDTVDNDCDGDIDEADAIDQPTWYLDFDSDTFGSAFATAVACVAPSGFVGNDADCNDGAADVNPLAIEICDGVDNNCNGQIDEGATNTVTWYADTDNDGFGDPATGVQGCAQPAGYVDDATDCDDTSAAVNPLQDEICDQLDNDCDGTVDIGASDASRWFGDADNDGFGNPQAVTLACSLPANHAANDDDCNDLAAQTYPGAPEVCDTADNDCDGLVDENPVDGQTWYRDLDMDGFGNEGWTTVACVQPQGYVANDGDCADNLASVNPAGLEVCDGIDNDCNGTIDDAANLTTWYEDADNDFFGNPNQSTQACTPPSGYIADNRDCNDSESAVNPLAPEVCDGLDNDCNTLIDDDATDAGTWFVDNDSDLFGDDATEVVACAAPLNGVSAGGDCDDNQSAVNPGQTEVCDGLDNDCDGLVDDGATDTTTWYLDLDFDGYAGNTTVDACEAPENGYATSDDCDDAQDDTYPGATERCDGEDNDCDTLIDEGGAAATTWYQDLDGDGYGTGPTQASCTPPVGYADNDLDCDDLEAAVNPAAEEICDSMDNDCDGLIDADAVDRQIFYVDADEDGFGNPLGASLACELQDGLVDNADDCEDFDADINPDAEEVCDGLDNNCDDDIDGDATDRTLFYRDTDGDGFAGNTYTTMACEAPETYFDTATDCDDLEDDTYPGAPELCDLQDNNCNLVIDEGVGSVSYYLDADADGFGTGTAQTGCNIPLGSSAQGGDCDDARADINPAQAEVCDGLDNDCDGDIDGSAIDRQLYFADNDSDSYGDATSSVFACDAPTGYVSNYSDCNDMEAAAFPGGVEVCDSLDNDCNGQVDDNASDAVLYYRDVDGDGYAGTAVSTLACEAPAGFLATATDCNDGQDDTYPGAPELCDSADNDCNGLVDDNVISGQDYWPDADSDGEGDANALPSQVVTACVAPPGYQPNNLDCDDSTNQRATYLDEVCDQIDNDCDLVVDNDAIDQVTWFVDSDDDGYGDANQPVLACDEPANASANGIDCDDALASVNPGQDEVCDSEDNDCDGVTDTNAIDRDLWYRDADGDGYAGEEELLSCDAPVGYYMTSDDCQDADDDIFPGASELCDGLDNNCNQLIDEDSAIDTTPWYRDADGDYFGDPADEVFACGPPLGYVGVADDCDDAVAAVNPIATEVCDGIDNNCDGQLDDHTAVDAIAWYADLDNDGYGDENDEILHCDQPTDYVLDATDCDDTTDLVNPSELEDCNGIDDDCSGFGDDNNAGCPCDVHYYYGDSRPYMFCETTENWEDALDECEAYGYHLLTVNGSYENIWADGVSDSYSHQEKWWIGYNDRDVEGDFVWEDGTPVDYENWHAGEPNNAALGPNSEENCTQFNRYGDQTWNDEPCEWDFKYICEFGE